MLYIVVSHDSIRGCGRPLVGWSVGLTVDLLVRWLVILLLGGQRRAGKQLILCIQTYVYLLWFFPLFIHSFIHSFFHLISELGHQVCSLLQMFFSSLQFLAALTVGWSIEESVNWSVVQLVGPLVADCSEPATYGNRPCLFIHSFIQKFVLLFTSLFIHSFIYLFMQYCKICLLIACIFIFLLIWTRKL